LKKKQDTDFLKKKIASFETFKKGAKTKALKRAYDVLPQLKILEKYKAGIHETYDLSRQELRAAINRYIIGYFGDSIYHSTLAIETALLVKLDETLSQEEKDAIQRSINPKNAKPLSFTFGVILDEANRSGREIISNTDVEQKIRFLIEIRNRYIHASNLNAAFIKSYKEKLIPQIELGLGRIDSIQTNSIINLMFKNFLSKAKDLLEENQRVIVNLPSFEWCTKEKTKITTQDGVDAFLDEIFNRIEKEVDRRPNTVSAKVDLALKSKDFISELSEDNYSRENALKSIQVTLEILEEFGMI
jgi:hypothetical protein